MFISLALLLSSLEGYSDEEYVMAFFVFTLIIALFFFTRYFFYTYLIEKRQLGKVVRPMKYSDAQAHAALLKYFPYYQGLDVLNRKRFLKRVKQFIQIKLFIPRQTKANETVNLLIAATGVQLTFGLRDFSLYSFEKILIYPDTYYSEIRKTHHKGEINVPHRLIVFAAKHFLSGVKDPNDGINLGLHEMAHALNVHSFEEGNREMMNRFAQWSDCALPEMEVIAQSEKHFLRKYAASNIEEMFAVCTENFFERPEAFSKALPALYEKTMELLQQDPRNHASPLLQYR